MNPIEQYRARAAEFEARARQEMDPAVRIEWENIARSYLRLAEWAARSMVPAQPQHVAHFASTPTPPRWAEVIGREVLPPGAAGTAASEKRNPRL